MDIALNVRSKTDNSIQESKLPLAGRVLLGRGPDCVVLLDGQGISREHLAIETDDSAIYLTDMSSNGTWLNGKRLAQNNRSKVENDALIEVPGYEIRVRTSAAPTQHVSPVVRQDDSVSAAAAESSFTTSFTLLEKFAAVTSLASAALLIFYIVS